jgi:hypothetical protein
MLDSHREHRGHRGTGFDRTDSNRLGGHRPSSVDSVLSVATLEAVPRLAIGSPSGGTIGSLTPRRPYSSSLTMLPPPCRIGLVSRPAYGYGLCSATVANGRTCRGSMCHELATAFGCAKTIVRVSSIRSPAVSTMRATTFRGSRIRLWTYKIAAETPKGPFFRCGHTTA